MKSSVKKALKITAITLGSFIVLATAVIGIVIYFIFTPARITPIVRNAANEMLDAQLDVESVELTFFSTFPQFGLKSRTGNCSPNPIVRNTKPHKILCYRSPIAP